MRIYQTKRPLRSDNGFVLIWGVLLFVPVFLSGIIFLLYGKANVTKARAQLMSIGLAHIGAYSAEFDSKETLNVMAAYAHASGFPSSVEPESLSPQSFGDYGQLKFVHDTEKVGFHSVHAYVELNQDPISSLIAHIADIQTSSFASTKPEDIYVSLTIDNSRSLVKDHEISDLLCAFGVSDCNSVTVPGMNGKVPPASSLTSSPEVWPQAGVQIALPHLIIPHYSSSRSWQELTSEYPQYDSFQAGCVALPESGCGGLPADHRSANDNYQTNLFMAYKKVSTLITGVVGQITAFTDVSLLGSPYPKETQHGVNAGLVGAPAILDFDGNAVQNPLDYSNIDPGIPSGYEFSSTYYQSPQNFYIFLNRGVEPIWRYDQDVRTNLQDGTGTQLATADIAGTRSRANPRNMFSDSISMMPDNMMQKNLRGTWARKKATYGTFYTSTARTGATQVTFPNNDYKEWFLPALPIFENPPSDHWPPTDSFAFAPGARDPITDAFPNPGTPDSPYAWPWFPVPLYAETGKAHPTEAELPVDMKHSFSYLCEYGTRSDMNLPTATDMDPDTLGYGTPQRALCKIKHFCEWISALKNGTGNASLSNTNCDSIGGSGPIEVGETTPYMDPDRLPSPRCVTAGNVHDPDLLPRCYYNIEDPVFNPVALPVCLRGKMYCVGERSYEVTRQVGCMDKDSNQFVGVVPSVEAGNSPLTLGAQPICDPGHGFPVGTVYPPSHYRKKLVAFGEDPMEVTAADDASPFYQGSMSLPDTAPDIEHNSLFFFIMDMSYRNGGTWTEDAVRYATARSQAFDPEHRVMLLITDGRPEPTLEVEGNIYSDDEYLDQLEASMDTFTDDDFGGISFTWLLGFYNSLEEFQDWMDLNASTDAQVDFNLSYAQLGLPVDVGDLCDGSSCVDLLNGWKPKGYTAEKYNQLIADNDALERFKTIMHSPDHNRFLVETPVSSTDSEAHFESLNYFLSRMRQILALLKRSPNLMH